MCAGGRGRSGRCTTSSSGTRRRGRRSHAPAEYFLTFADSASLDRTALPSCLSRRAVRAEVKSDAEAAVRSGAKSTPSFYIEGGILAGAQPVAVFRPILDSIYAAKTQAVTAQARVSDEEHVVERVGPRGDAEAAQQVERAEQHAGHRPEGERPQFEHVAVRADVVEGRKDERADQHREHPRRQGAHPKTRRASRASSDTSSTRKSSSS